MVCHAPQVAEAKTPQQMDVAGESLLYAESVVRILVYCQPATVTCHVADKVLCYHGPGELHYEYRKTKQKNV
jgi:hypothetical protein